MLALSVILPGGLAFSVTIPAEFALSSGAHRPRPRSSEGRAHGDNSQRRSHSESSFPAMFALIVIIELIVIIPGDVRSR